MWLKLQKRWEEEKGGGGGNGDGSGGGWATLNNFILSFAGTAVFGT